VKDERGREDVLTADEVARFLRLDRKTVYEAAATGRIPARRIGRRFLFYRPALVAWLGDARPRRADMEGGSNVSKT